VLSPTPRSVAGSASPHFGFQTRARSTQTKRRSTQTERRSSPRASATASAPPALLPPPRVTLATRSWLLPEIGFQSTGAGSSLPYSEGTLAGTATSCSGKAARASRIPARAASQREPHPSESGDPYRSPAPQHRHYRTVAVRPLNAGSV